MIGFLKKVLGGGEPVKERRLSHPCDLRQGDFVKFKFMPQPDVSGKTFEIFKVNTYTYDGVHYPEMILKDREGNIVFMMVEEEDGEEYVCLSKKVEKSDIREVLSQEFLDEIKEKGEGLNVSVSSIPQGFGNWIVNNYKVTDVYNASFAKGDARYDQHGADERFQSYELTDKSDEYALEIEIYGQGETELSATVFHDINVIEEILPGNSRDM